MVLPGFSSFLHRCRLEREQMGLINVNHTFLSTIPWITIGIAVWFLIAWFSHTSIINSATNSKPLERKENKRVYNLVENLCISTGMQMPKVNIIEDDSLNAFASGINEKTYSRVSVAGYYRQA